MSKYKEYNLTVNFIDLLKIPIRTKADIVTLLLNSLELMLTDVHVVDRGIGAFCINVNKMSRIFFSANIEGFMKNFSFSFPFSFFIEDETVKKLYSTVTKIEIDKTVVRILLDLAAEGFFNEREVNINIYDELDTILTSVKSNVKEESLVDYYEEIVWSISKELLIFEPGYLRYDYDEERADAEMHPLHHIDICYSSQATFKLGLQKTIIKNNQFERVEFINVLDITTPCYYISN